MNSCQKYFSVCLLGITALLVGASPAWAQTAPDLGTASSFAALGNAGVTCDAAPVSPVPTVTGDVGTGPGALSVTGFPNLCTLSGNIVLDAPAFAVFQTAYGTTDTANPCPTDAAHNLVGDLGGKTLLPGIYCISGVGGGDAPALLTNTLTLNGNGDSNAVWIFKGVSVTPIGTAALRSTVRMINGGQSCNVYWRLGTAATFVSTDFVGNVLAGSKVTFSDSSLAGRAMASTESVTMTAGSSITACDGGGTQPPPPPSCDKDHKHHKHASHHKHHKHASHHKHDKQQCDDDHDDGDHGDDEGDHGDDDHGDGDHRDGHNDRK
jgi:hypothetical protein